MSKHVYETEDGVRIAPLGELKDLEVAEGYPDIRGWRVDASDGQQVGKVRELLVDVDTMRTRYLSVRLTSEIAASPTDRDVLIPIGAAQISDGDDVVRLPLATDRVALLPPYEHSKLSRAHEFEVRRHFSYSAPAAGAMGTAAGTSAGLASDPPSNATTGTTAGATAGATQRHFYDDEAYDDRRFFSPRRRTKASDLANRDLANRDLGDRDLAARDRTAAQRDIRLDEDEIRVPVDREESVVLKRGDDGRDEIIIRRAASDPDAGRR